MSVQDYQVNYSINVEAKGVDQLRQFGESVQKITQAKAPLDTAVSNIQKMMNSIDSIFRDKNGKARQYNYSVKIETKGTEDRLNRVVALLDQIRTKSKDIKLNIAAGKPLTAAQVKANAKNIADQNSQIAKQLGGTGLLNQKDITKSIGKINSALAHLERGRELNIKTDTAKARLNEILTLLGRVGNATGRSIQLGGVMGGAVNATRAPFAPGMPGAYMLPAAAQAKLNQKLVTNQALQQQRILHSNQTAAERIQQQARTDAARIERQNQQRVIRQQQAEQKRIAAQQQKAIRDAQRLRQQQATDVVRGHVRSNAMQQSIYGGTRRAAINRLQYSRPPSLRTAIPFGYMLNGYMLYSMMRREVTAAVEYSNTMESARSILRVADNDLGTFEARFNQMALNVRKVGVETKFTAVEVAGAVKYLAMAGQNIDTINKSIRPITNLALIGDNDISQIADLVTNVMAGYDINPDSMPSVADIIASTISRSNVNIIETAESFKMAAGTLRMAGVDFTEGAAAIGLLGNMGLKGTLSGTSLRAITTRLANPTKSTQETLGRLGVNFKEKVNIYGNEVERFRPLADIFESFSKAGATLEDMYKIFGVRGANAAMMLLQNYEQLRTLSGHNRRSTGISAELADVKQNTTKGLWFQMTSRFSETFMKGFEIMEPQIQTLLRDFIAKFDTEKFAKGLASLGSALMDLFRLLGNIATWFAGNFTWLGPTIFTGVVATKLFKLAGAVTNLGVALGFLGKKSAALSGVQLLSSLTGLGRINLGAMSFGDKRGLVTALRGMGVTGKNTMVRSLAGAGLGGGVKSIVGSGAASGVFASQVATGRGIVGAGASLGALGTGAVVAAGAFGILAAAIGVVAYKTWKMAEIHRGVMEELEKKEKYSFPSIDAMYTSLNRTYNEAKRVKNAVDDLTAEKLVIDETGQPMGVFSRRGWQAFFNSFAMSHGPVEGLELYTYSDAYQDNIKEGLTTLARQQAVGIRTSFIGELAKQQTPLETAAFIRTIPDFYNLDLNTVDTSLYTNGTYRNGTNKGQEWNSYNAQTGEGQYVTGLKKEMTIAQGMRTGTYMNWINTNLVPELTQYAQEYQNIISSQSYAEQALSKAGLDFHELYELGFRKDPKTGQWGQELLSTNATTEQKEQHLVNSRLIHNDLLMMMSKLRTYWQGSGEIAETIMKAAGIPLHLLTNEPDRNDMNPWNKPGISSEDGDDDGGAGGNYSGTGKLSSAAPKQVIVNITNLLSVETIELLKTTDGKHPEIQDLKEQMAEALISVVHDFDASWNA